MILRWDPLGKQKMCLRRLMFAAILCAQVYTPASSDAGVVRHELPRSFGAISLLMTTDGFNKLANTKTDVCPHCARNEEHIGLYVWEHPNLFPKEYLASIPKRIISGRTYAAGFAFFKRHLYKIEIPFLPSTITSVKKQYIERYGPETREVKWENGVSWLIWENKATALEISFIREKNSIGSFYRNESVGDVLGIYYLDRPLRDALKKQEREHPSHSH